MNNIKEIRSVLIEKTDFLRKVGFEKVIEKSEIRSFTLSYLALDKGLAIEFEIDYLDLDVFVLVTILENGKLPKGYYMHKDKTVRFHLERLFESGKIKTGDWKKIIKLRRELKNQRERKILVLIEAYCDLLMEAISDIQDLNFEVI